MADLADVFGSDFDPTSVPEDERSFDLLPAGDYVMQIIESELKPKDNGDCGLNLTIEIIDGPFANRKIWDWLNIRHSNPQAQSIAQRALADLCLATGVQGLRDSEELHFKPFIGTVKINPAKGNYEASNGIKRYKPMSGGGAPRQAPAPARVAPAAAAQASRPAAGGNAPWRR
ncbi:DUF669 domain-containing protein [Bosea sp. AS-1]|uniref:DUF669 domain-containing protein n=1 Tax=Bosea sp. AS-1 TaxID=2015316 RepID=UPI000B78DED8|nr:DUF669 domain-containing protein [Bosea sp. AS-1]